jgi:hypothetical protein
MLVLVGWRAALFGELKVGSAERNGGSRRGCSFDLWGAWSRGYGLLCVPWSCLSVRGREKGAGTVLVWM